MTEVPEECDECGGKRIDFNHTKGEYSCYGCGLVLLDEIPEDTSAGRERAADPLSERTHEVVREGYYLGSFVGNTKYGGGLDRSKAGRILRRTEQRTLPSHMRTVRKGLIQCNMVAGELGSSPQMRDRIAWVYKKLMKDHQLRGYALEDRAAAIVYFCYKESGILIRIDEVCETNAAHPRKVAKLARIIARLFKKPFVLSQRNIASDIEKYCSLMDVDRETTQNAIKLSVPLEDIGNHLCLTMNVGWTGSIIYLTMRLGPQNTRSYRTQRDICTTLGVTEVTIRNNFKIIIELLGLDKENLLKYTVEDVIAGAYDNVKKKE